MMAFIIGAVVGMLAGMALTLGLQTWHETHRRYFTL